MLSKSAEESSVGEPPTTANARRRWAVLAIAATAQLMVVLDATIVNIALPSAQADLGFSDTSRQWIVTGYALTFGSLLLLGGRIADLFGRRVTFLIGLAGFAIASAIGGAAPNFELLVAARVGQGLFGALLAPTTLSLLTVTFTDPEERNKAFGIFGAVAAGGGALGLLLGGLLTEYASWRWTMYVNLFLAAGALAGGAFLLERAGRRTKAKLDVLGTVLVCAGLFGLVYGLSQAESEGWDSPTTWGILIASALLLTAFVWWQTRTQHPLLPLRILLDRNRAASFLARLISGAGMFGIFLFLTYYLQQTLGYSPISTGLAFMPMVAGILVGSTLATTALPRFGPKVIVPLGMAASIGGLILLTQLGLDSAYATHVLPALVISGLGLAFIVTPSTSLATFGVEAADTGVASALVNTCQQIGGSVGTALLTSVYADTTKNYLAGRNPDDPQVLAHAALNGYSSAYWWSVSIFAVGIVISFLLYRRSRASVPRASEPRVRRPRGSRRASAAPTSEAPTSEGDADQLVRRV
ncbi:MFS transporter [Streptomyces sp. NPDC090106]|uniref:MFS transporter n=1 Tax=Streptomyces sp. NPDC090106 TaxID=3365946 RepID=UPI00380C441F